MIVTVGFAVLLYLAGTTVPGGLTKAEEQAFIQSSELDLQNIDNFTIVSLPFYVAQRTALEMFGPSVISDQTLGTGFSLVTGIGAVLLPALVSVKHCAFCNRYHDHHRAVYHSEVGTPSNFTSCV